MKFLLKVAVLLFMASYSVKACLNDTYCETCNMVPVGFDSLGNLYVTFICGACVENMEFNSDNECICIDEYFMDKNSKCITCSNNSHSVNDQECVCNDGFYNSTDNICQKCPEECETCSQDQCFACKPSLNRQLSYGKCSCIEGYQQIQGKLECEDMCTNKYNKTKVDGVCQCMEQYVQVQGTDRCEKEPNLLMIILSSLGSLLCFVFSTFFCLCIRMRGGRQQIHDAKKKKDSQNMEVEIYESYDSTGPLENTSNMFWNNKKIEYSAEEICSICLDRSPLFMTECGHYFHSKCIYNWLEKRGNCPNCNKEIDSKHIRRWCEKCKQVLMPVIRNVIIKRTGRNGKKKKQLVQSTPVEHQLCDDCEAIETEEIQSQKHQLEQN